MPTEPVEAILPCIEALPKADAALFKKYPALLAGHEAQVALLKECQQKAKEEQADIQSAIDIANEITDRN